MEEQSKDIRWGKNEPFKQINIGTQFTIGVFQGSRGNNPDLDIVVRYKQDNKRVRTPKHMHWAIDLLLKKEHNRELTLKFVQFLLDMWSKVEPFQNKSEQHECNLVVSKESNLKEFEELNNFGEYPVEFISTVLELLMIQEKTGLQTAFMFKGVLDSILNEKDIFSIVSSAGYTGR